MPLQVLPLPSKAEVTQPFPRASTSLPCSEAALSTQHKVLYLELLVSLEKEYLNASHTNGILQGAPFLLFPIKQQRDN